MEDSKESASERKNLDLWVKVSQQIFARFGALGLVISPEIGSRQYFMVSGLEDSGDSEKNNRYAIVLVNFALRESILGKPPYSLKANESVIHFLGMLDYEVVDFKDVPVGVCIGPIVSEIEGVKIHQSF